MPGGHRIHLTRLTSLTLYLLLGAACGRQDSPPAAGPQGKPKQEDTRILETGAQALQSFEPVGALDTYLDGFHAMKDHPEHTMEAHHFCRAGNEEFMQCAIFDANTANANLVGIEYIISERLYDTLSADEQALWHPHNYEILSGQLVAPGLPEVAEHAFLEKKVNSYGKTWHTWDTGAPEQKTLPLGSPMLAWSFNADRELDPLVLQQRDKRMNLDSGRKREARRDLTSKAHPQGGVHALAPAFPNREVPAYVKERSPEHVDAAH
jgi:hypothetical protein